MKTIVKRMIVFSLATLVVLYVAFRIDKAYYMLQRVKNDKWIIESGYRAGNSDLINSEGYTIKGDTLIFHDGDKVIVKYQYFDFLIISDSLNETKGTYARLGSHRKK